MRSGGDYHHPYPHHTLLTVHREMLYQIASDYPGLPDVRTMTIGEVRWWYEGLRPSLRKATGASKG